MRTSVVCKSPVSRPVLMVSLAALTAVVSSAHAEQGQWTTVAKTANAEAGSHPSDGRQAPDKEKSGKSDKDDAEEKPTVNTDRAVTPSATVNLINMLVKQKVITQDQADQLIPQVADESMVTGEAVKNATTKADEAAKAATAAASAATPKGSKRVSYVPEVVKQQLRDEIRSEVMNQAKKENWASPGKYPEWASRIRLYGDFRARYEGIYYPGAGYNPTKNSDVTPDYIDYNAINAGSPYDVSELNPVAPSLINGNQDRDRYRIRARIGLDADLSDDFKAGMRLATGSDSSPVSTNQTLGGSGGNFSKYSIWLDRAWLSYDVDGSTFERYGIYPSATIKVGRFDNPFWRSTEFVWDNDVGFDGAAVQWTYPVHSNFTAFAVGGAFPIFNTALDFGSTEGAKFNSNDKYLYGGQVGFNWRLHPNIAFTMAASLFDFDNVQGKVSDPCDVTQTTSCSTDASRPSFAQRGNTYIPIRNIIAPAGSTTGDKSYAQPEYFGLASEYVPLVLSGRLDLTHFNPVHVVFDGEFVWNTAFNRSRLENGVQLLDPTIGTLLNNRGSVESGAHYDGGNIGWTGKVTVGHTKFEAFGDWNAFLGYKYMESDATLDAFTDSDFGLGGTNLKGYFVGGNYAFSKNVSSTITWMSADAIAGSPYAVDILQVDLNAKF